jgi:DnaJ-class molecular chaperone
MNYENLLKNFEKCGDLYKTLNIDPTADKKIIKKAYKDLALIYHPDKNKSTDASSVYYH